MKKHYVLLVALLSFQIGISQTVYITQTGKKYHAAGCRYLRSSSNAIDLSKAISSGYGACSVCNPGTGNNTKSSKVIPVNQIKNVSNDQSSGTTQCTATTKKGSQCRRMTKSSNGKCWQHGGQ